MTARIVTVVLFAFSLGTILGYREAMYHAAACQADCDTLPGRNICGPWLHAGDDYCVPVVP